MFVIPVSQYDYTDFAVARAWCALSTRIEPDIGEIETSLTFLENLRPFQTTEFRRNLKNKGNTGRDPQDELENAAYRRFNLDIDVNSV